MSVNAAVPRITRSAPARRALRTAASDRSPPPYWTGHRQLVGDLLEVLEVLRRAALGTVEVDDVQEARAGVDPGAAASSGESW